MWTSRKYTYVPFFLNLRSTPHPITPLQVVTEHWADLPVPDSSSPLALYFTYGHVKCFSVTLSIRPALSFPCCVQICSLCLPVWLADKFICDSPTLNTRRSGGRPKVETDPDWNGQYQPHPRAGARCLAAVSSKHPVRGKPKTRPAFQARSQADPGDQAQQASE